MKRWKRIGEKNERKWEPETLTKAQNKEEKTQTSKQTKEKKPATCFTLSSPIVEMVGSVKKKTGWV